MRGLASHFVWTNRSKESLTLDLKHQAAATILARLLARADVLVQNLAPGAAARLGLSYEALSASLPRLIVCDISGYGNDGPYRDKKAYDLLIQSEAGLLAVTGTPGAVAKAGCSVADIASGMYAYSQILAALLQRGENGRGSHLEISMFESMLEWMGYPLYYTLDDAPPPPRAGAAHATIYPYGPFTAGDGKTIMLAVQNEREWHAFCREVIGRPDLAVDPRYAGNTLRSAARDELAPQIAACFATLNADDLLARLDAAQIANARVNDLQEVWQHPQLRARDRWREVQSEAGPLPALLPPWTSSAYTARMDPIPALGEHTEAILGELGCNATEIADLRRAGAI